MKYIFIYIFNLVLFFNLVSQHPDLKFTRYNVEDGLTNTDVYAIEQDSEGYIWVGTAHGLNRFDGYTFKHFYNKPEDSTSISHNFVWDIHKDKTGVLWLATENGLNKYNKTTLQFTRYFHSENDTTTISNNFVRAIYEDKAGVLWFGTIDGLNRYNRKENNFKRFNNGKNKKNGFGKNYILSIYEDSENNFWIGSANGSLTKFNRKTRQHKNYTTFSYLGKELSPRWIAEDASNQLWFGCWESRIFKVDRSYGETNLILQEKYNEITLGKGYQTALLDKNKRFWISCDEKLYLYQPKQDTFLCYQHEPFNNRSLSGNTSIRSIFEDRGGNIWIGSIGGGLNKVSKESMQFHLLINDPLNKNSLHSNSVRAIYEDKNNTIWIGTDANGVNSFNRGLFKLNYFFDWQIDNLASIAEDNENNIWFGKRYWGISKYNLLTGSITSFYTNRADSIKNKYFSIIKILKISDGKMLVITDRGGLYVFKPGNDKPNCYLHDKNNSTSISSNHLRSVFQDSSGNIWVGASNGLNKFIIHEGKFERYVYKPDDISHKNKNEFNSIIEDKNGDLWLGTNDGGLGKFDAGTKTFSWHSTENGLENTRIYGLLNDNSGNIWMSTDNGIFKFNTTSFKSKKYTYHDGLQGNSFWAHSYLKASDGFMYFGGKNGLTYFHPDSIKENPYPPQIVVTDLQIFNKSVVGNNKLPYTYDLYKNRQILLSYDQDVFSIHFAALHYSAPKKNSYKYMLEGHNNKWYNIGTQRFVTFSGLQAGSYNFRLKASNSSGVWNKKGISIKLIITPPFWETWWFRLVIFLLFVSIVYLIYRRRLANIRKIEMIRIKIAQDLHDEIGSNLGSIAVLSKMLKRKSIPDAKKTGYLDSIYTTAIKTADSMRDIVWFINPDNDDADKILMRIKDFVSKILVNVKYELNIFDNVFTDKLPLNVKRNIYLIIKESLNNIAKHANATFVKIEIQQTNNCLNLLVEDNGIGFDLKTKSSGSGLKNLEKRASEIGAKFIIESKKGVGTKSTLIFET